MLHSRLDLCRETIIMASKKMVVLEARKNTNEMEQPSSSTAPTQEAEATAAEATFQQPPQQQQQMQPPQQQMQQPQPSQQFWPAQQPSYNNFAPPQAESCTVYGPHNASWVSQPFNLPQEVQQQQQQPPPPQSQSPRKVCSKMGDCVPKFFVNLRKVTGPSETLDRATLEFVCDCDDSEKPKAGQGGKDMKKLRKSCNQSASAGLEEREVVEIKEEPVSDHEVIDVVASSPGAAESPLNICASQQDLDLTKTPETNGKAPETSGAPQKRRKRIKQRALSSSSSRSSSRSGPADANSDNDLDSEDVDKQIEQCNHIQKKLLKIKAEKKGEKRRKKKARKLASSSEDDESSDEEQQAQPRAASPPPTKDASARREVSPTPTS